MSSSSGNQPPRKPPRALSGLGVTSAVCGLCGYFFLLSAFFGVIFGLLGIARDRRDVLSWAGILLSVIFIVLGIASMCRLCSGPGLDAMLSGSV